MDLSGIISISGKPGLYQMVAQARNGIIVESLADGKRMHAAASYRISALEDISIYTDGDDVPLSDVFRKIYEMEKGGKTIETKDKSVEDLRKQFAKVLKNFDEERVYDSDIKKLFNWYNMLHDAKALKLKEVEGKEEEAEEGAPKKAKAKKEGDPAKKAAAKKDDKKSDAKTANKPAAKDDTKKAPAKKKPAAGAKPVVKPTALKPKAASTKKAAPAKVSTKKVSRSGKK